MTKNSKNNNSNSRGNRPARAGESIPRNKLSIPVLKTDAIQTFTWRLYVNAAVSTPLAFSKELPFWPWGIAVETGNLVIPFKACALRRLKIWNQYDPAATSIAGNTINLRFTGIQGVPTVELSDTASQFTMACIDYVPNSSHPLGWFYETANSINNPVVHFQVLHHSLIEITVAYILSDGSQGSGKFQSTTGVSLGQLYTNSIDGSLDVVGRSAEYPISY